MTSFFIIHNVFVSHIPSVNLPVFKHSVADYDVQDAFYCRCIGYYGPFHMVAICRFGQREVIQNATRIQGLFR